MNKINPIFTFKNGIVNSLVVSLDGKQYTADATHTNWSMILDAIRKDDVDSFLKSIDVRQAFLNYTVGNVRIVGNEVWYGETRLGGVVVDRIFDFMHNNLPVEPIMRFINKLYQNPSMRAVNELYKFLEHKNLPITSEGNFRAYKGLLPDFYSITAGNLTLLQGKVNRSGRIFNGIGETIECVRHQVDDDKDNHCSKGLHAGSLEYATGFAQGKMVEVEINPKDVVSIPADCNCQKLRCCKYTVVKEFEKPLDDVYIKTTDEFNNNPIPNDSGDEDEDFDEFDGTDDGCYEDDEFSNDYYTGYDHGFNDADEGNGYDASKYADEVEDSMDDFKAGYNDGWNDHSIV